MIGQIIDTIKNSIRTANDFGNKPSDCINFDIEIDDAIKLTMLWGDTYCSYPTETMVYLTDHILDGEITKRLNDCPVQELRLFNNNLAIYCW